MVGCGSPLCVDQAHSAGRDVQGNLRLKRWVLNSIPLTPLARKFFAESVPGAPISFCVLIRADWERPQPGAMLMYKGRVVKARVWFTRHMRFSGKAIDQSPFKVGQQVTCIAGCKEGLLTVHFDRGVAQAVIKDRKVHQKPPASVLQRVMPGLEFRGVRGMLDAALNIVAPRDIGGRTKKFVRDHGVLAAVAVHDRNVGRSFGAMLANAVKTILTKPRVKKRWKTVARPVRAELTWLDRQCVRSSGKAVDLAVYVRWL